MPLYAGACSADITPPPGLWMCGYSPRLTSAAGVHDPLHAHALVLDDGGQRLVLVSADVISFPPDLVTTLRTDIAAATGAEPAAIMLHGTHTHGGPYIGAFRGMGECNPAYQEILRLKVAGAAKQAAASLRPAQITYGEAPAQIGMNRRIARSRTRGAPAARNCAGPVCPLVQTVCLAEPGGHTFGILFSHACHPTTVGGDNLHFTAEWPGEAASELKRRFAQEGPAGGIETSAFAMPLQGCCGDINPIRRGSWEAVAQNGEIVAGAALSARWNAHIGQSGALKCREIVLSLPTAPPVAEQQSRADLTRWQAELERYRASAADEGRLAHCRCHIEWANDQLQRARSEPAGGTIEFRIQLLDLGAALVLGFPAEMFVSYQLDLMRQSRRPVVALGHTNGCLNYLPSAADYADGGYEVNEACKYYGNPMFSPDCEMLVRAACYELLDIAEPDLAPYASASVGAI